MCFVQIGARRLKFVWFTEAKVFKELVMEEMEAGVKQLLPHFVAKDGI